MGLLDIFKKKKDTPKPPLEAIVEMRVNPNYTRTPNSGVESKFEFYESQIKDWYKQRESNPEAIAKTIEACENQINLTPDMVKLFKERMSKYESEKEKAGYLTDINEDEEIKKIMPNMDETFQALKNSDKATLKKHDEVNHKIDILKNLNELKNSAVFILHRRHVGYTQLCVIRAKEGNWNEVLRLAAQAKHEGWYGDWDDRIDRAQKKLDK
jgi:hypothetical protein